MKRGVSTGLTTLYWIVLPLVALGMIGWAGVVATQRSAASSTAWIGLATSLGLALLLIWRLWVHARARKSANGIVSQTETSEISDD